METNCGEDRLAAAAAAAAATVCLKNVKLLASLVVGRCAHLHARREGVPLRFGGWCC
jgi:hypothetical protein